MTDPRVLVAPGALVTGATAALDDEEQHHLRVRRLRTGQSVQVLDGVGGDGEGTLVDTPAGPGVSIGAVTRLPPPPVTIIAVGAGDRQRFLSLAEKCTELGVTVLVPLLTERSGDVETRVRPATIDRARRRAREACKQSGNRWAATVADRCALADLAARYAAQWLIADPAGEQLPPLERGLPVAWLVGPEGGFTVEETALADERLAARAVRLAPSTLRYETAVMVAAALTLDRRAVIEEA